MANTAKFKAITRVSRDLRQIQSGDPLPGLAITPVSEDLLTLHVNIRVEEGVYKGAVLHCILHVPDTYPIVGPSMDIAPSLYIRHEHIYGTSICNDLLTNFKDWFRHQDADAGPPLASGWSSSYTLREVLVVMQQFFADPDISVSEAQRERTLQSCVDHVCKECGHTGAVPHPPFPSEPCGEQGGGETESPSTATNNNDPRGRESREEENRGEELTATTTESSRQQLLDETKCYVTKKGVEERGTVLGFGVSVETDRIGRQTLSSPLELLSLEAFESGCRRSTLQEAFTEFLPLYINDYHWQRARLHAERSLCSILNREPFEPAMVLEVIPKLMNLMVVQFVRGELHASDTAIEGYCYFLRLMDAFTETYPKLKDSIDFTIYDFVSNPDRRCKAHVPDLGQFLVLVTLSRVKWETVRLAYVHEHFSRSILWILRKNSGIFQLPPRDLVGEAFACSENGIHLLLFNLEIAKRFTATNDSRFHPLDLRYGRAHAGDIAAMKEVLTRVRGIQSYDAYLDTIGYSFPTENWVSFMNHKLREARARSRELRYHFIRDNGKVCSPSHRGRAAPSSRGRERGRRSSSDSHHNNHTSHTNHSTHRGKGNSRRGGRGGGGGRRGGRGRRGGLANGASAPRSPASSSRLNTGPSISPALRGKAIPVKGKGVGSNNQTVVQSMYAVLEEEDGAFLSTSDTSETTASSDWSWSAAVLAASEPRSLSIPEIIERLQALGVSHGAAADAARRAQGDLDMAVRIAIPDRDVG